MINIKINNIGEVVEWYQEAVVPLVVKRKMTHRPTDSFESIICKDLDSSFFCADVIRLPVEELTLKYEWIRDYKKTIEFCGFATYLNANTKSKSSKNGDLASIRRGCLNKYINVVIDNLLESYLVNSSKEERIEKVTSSKKEFISFLKIVKNRIKDINNIIIQKFNYDEVLGDSEIRGKLVKKLDIKVCPYCNRQYINPLTYDNKNKYMGDIDHILPKSSYALFQLSFFNMIPSCKVCNQLFKGQKNLNLLNPYFEGFDDDAYLEMRYASVKELVGLVEPKDYSWEIKYNKEEKNSQIKDKFNKVKCNIDTFKLNEVYKTSASEFQRILRLKYINESQIYRNCIDNILNVGKYNNLEQFDDRLIYGVSLDEDHFQDEILSKAIYDIVMRN